LHPKLHRSLFGITAICIFVYLLIRCFTVPISHDEAATFFHYIQSGKFIPYYALWDANNHFLNSLLVYPLYKLFGSDLIWLRLPNLLFFWVYAYFAYKLSGSIKNNFLQVTTSIALITAPFLIEFFAQTRGYGMSFALMMGAIYWLNSFLKTHLASHQLFTWLFIILALSANMSLMNSYLLIMGSIALILLFKTEKFSTKSNWIVFLVFGFIPFLAATKYALDMKEMRLLYYGLGDGLVPVTVKSLLKFGFNANSIPLAWIVATVGFLVSVVLIISFARRHFNNANPGTITAVLLLGNAVGAILLNLIMGVNFPEDRIALYFLPLFVISFGYCIDLAQRGLPSFKWAGLLLWAFPISLLAQLNLNHTLQWHDLAVSNKVYEFVKSEQEKMDEPLIISGYRLLEMSWGYNNVRSENLITPFAHNKRDTLHISDYVLCYAPTCSEYGDDYTEVFHDESNMKILKRKAPIELDFLYEPEMPLFFADKVEYHDVLDLSTDSIIKQANMVEIELKLSSEAAPLNTDLIITSSNSSNSNLYYDFIPLKWVRNSWNGETLKIRRPIALPLSSERLLIYLWNVEKAEQKIEVKSVKLFRVEPQ